KHKQRKHETAGTTADAGKMGRKEFEKELARLQVELTRLQTWVQAHGARVIVVFEGRDTAGKGGVISRITARTSPRVYRHVALPAPADREKSQVYIQRYVANFPAAGEIILFDRSWYNRAGVECTSRKRASRIGAPHWRLIWQSDHRCQICGVSFDAAFRTAQIFSRPPRAAVAALAAGRIQRREFPAAKQEKFAGESAVSRDPGANGRRIGGLDYSRFSRGRVTISVPVGPHCRVKAENCPRSHANAAVGNDAQRQGARGEAWAVDDHSLSGFSDKLEQGQIYPNLTASA